MSELDPDNQTPSPTRSSRETSTRLGIDIEDPVISTRGPAQTNSEQVEGEGGRSNEPQTSKAAPENQNIDTVLSALLAQFSTKEGSRAQSEGMLQDVWESLDIELAPGAQGEGDVSSEPPPGDKGSTPTVGPGEVPDAAPPTSQAPLSEAIKVGVDIISYRHRISTSVC